MSDPRHPRTALWTYYSGVSAILCFVDSWNILSVSIILHGAAVICEVCIHKPIINKLGLSYAKLSSRLPCYENHLPVSWSSCEVVFL